MIERAADKILGMIDDVRWTKNEIDYLAWQLVQKSNKPMLRRLIQLSSSIIIYKEEMTRDENDDTLW
jgi:hypothetical protein